jgi:hypothetical protein
MKAQMKTYHVSYSLEGDERCQSVPANSPGQAFFKCKQAHPRAVLRKCELRGSGLMAATWMSYDAPKNQDMPSTPHRNGAVEEAMTFAFYPQTASHKPLS